MKDLLLKEYDHQSKLWERRDKMRLDFLRFYYIFLGAIITVSGFLFDNQNLELYELVTNKIVILLMSMEIIIGISTFLIILRTRIHNYQSTFQMFSVAFHLKHLNKKDKIKKEKSKIDENLSDYKTKLKKHMIDPGGIDSINAGTIAIINCFLLFGFLYGLTNWVCLSTLGAGLFLFGHYLCWNTMLKKANLEICDWYYLMHPQVSDSCEHLD